MNSMSRSVHDSAAPEAEQVVESPKIARTKKPAAPVPTVEEAGKVSKPFSMSYGGGSTAEYLQYMIDRGAR
jgi:hypothetical protein